MNIKRVMLVLFFILFAALPVLAQDATAEPSLPVVMPPVTDVASASVTLVFAVIAAFAAGGLTVGALILLLLNNIMRSPVLLTAIEGLVFSKLDTDNIKHLRGVGTLFKTAGQFIDTVTDGKPNETQPPAPVIQPGLTAG